MHHLPIQEFDHSFLNPPIGRLYVRLGEAENPGPAQDSMLCVRTINPAQLLGNELTLQDWPKGLWTAAETSHTPAAMNVIRSRLRKQDINVQFGHPVDKLNDNSGIYRGRALGCANISALPLQPYPCQLEDGFTSICRSCDALVQLSQGVAMYSGVVYGPTSTNQYYADPERVFRHATAPIVERACMFRGPAMISGDMNRELVQCWFWPLLQSKGWADAAEMAWNLFGWKPEPTCRDKTRRSFLLVNHVLAQTLKSCYTVEHHVFDSHPVLQAEFDIATHFLPKEIWTLPRSADDVMLDTQILQDVCTNLCSHMQERFHDALEAKEVDIALNYVAQVFERACQQATATTEGYAATFPAGCLKKTCARLTKCKPVTKPLLKQARAGEHNFDICQARLVYGYDKELRRYVGLRAS